MKDYWSRDMKLLFWKDTCNILSTFTHSKHCYKEGDKQINLKLKLICCLDNNGGNINSKTGYHFIGNDGFWFVDENENVFSTNSKGFYDEEEEGEKIDMPTYPVNFTIGDKNLVENVNYPYQEGMIFSLNANIATGTKVHCEKVGCKYTRFHTVKNGRLLNPKKENVIGFKYLTPDRKLKISERMERGPNGKKVKDHFKNECQICKAQNKPYSNSFFKKDGCQYSEAHHVVQLSDKGTDFTENIMCLCANHHKQMHYGKTIVSFDDCNFYVTIDGEKLKPIPRWRNCDEERSTS